MSIRPPPKLPITSQVPFNTQYIACQVINDIIKTTTFPIEAIEEENSELWCYTYNGYGKMSFSDGSILTGRIVNGVLSTEGDQRGSSITFPNGTKYEGEINYDYIFKLFDEVGYKGFIGCEYNPRGSTMEGLQWIKPYLR